MFFQNIKIFYLNILYLRQRGDMVDIILETLSGDGTKEEDGPAEQGGSKRLNNCHKIYKLKSCPI